MTNKTMNIQLKISKERTRTRKANEKGKNIAYNTLKTLWIQIQKQQAIEQKQQALEQKQKQKQQAIEQKQQALEQKQKQKQQALEQKQKQKQQAIERKQQALEQKQKQQTLESIKYLFVVPKPEKPTKTEKPEKIKKIKLPPCKWHTGRPKPAHIKHPNLDAIRLKAVTRKKLQKLQK